MTQALPLSCGRGEIRCFTGLRGCAAVMVMLYHLTLETPLHCGRVQRFVANGYLWVDLFFVMSGFVLAYSQAKLFAGPYRLHSHVAFLISRVARIYPLYALVILESACLVVWRTGTVDPGTLGLNLLMLQGWGTAPSLEGAAWSVSAEWGAYLTFPFLLWLALQSTRPVSCLVALLAFLAIAYLALAPITLTLPGQSRNGPLDIYSSATPAPLLRCIAEFVFGVVACRFAGWSAAWLRQSSGAFAVGSLLLLVAALSRPGFDIAVVLLFCVLLVTLSYQQGRLALLLSMSVPVLLGRWSFSIYLIHDKFSHPAALLHLLLVPHVSFASTLAVLMTSATVLACSAATFSCVELPLRRLVTRAVPVLAPREMTAPAGARPEAAPTWLVGTGT